MGPRKAEPARVHAIVGMAWPEIRCACGWAFKLTEPGDWGTRAGQDHLLDMHAAHAARMDERGL